MQTNLNQFFFSNQDRQTENNMNFVLQTLAFQSGEKADFDYFDDLERKMLSFWLSILRVLQYWQKLIVLL